MADQRFATARRTAGHVAALRHSPVRAPHVLAVAVVSLGLAASVVWLMPKGFIDLRIYDGAIDHWLGGGGLYEFTRDRGVLGDLGFTYPPFAALVLSPLGLLPWKGAVLAAMLVTLVCGFVCSCLMVGAVATGPFDLGRLVGAGALSVAGFALQPWALTLAIGQVNLLLMAVVLADVLVLGTRGSRWAGVGIGLAMAVKLTPGVFLLYFVVRREWRQLATAIGTAVVATAVAAAIVPRDSWRYFTGYLWDTDRVGRLEYLWNQSLAGGLARLSAPAETPTWLLALLTVAVVVVVAVRLGRRADPAAPLPAITIVGVAGLLVSPVSWTHHAVWVVPVLLVTAAWLVRTRFADVPMVLRGLRLAFLVTTLIVWATPQRLVRLPTLGYAEVDLVGRVASVVPLLTLVAALALLPLRSDPRETLAGAVRRDPR